MGIKVVQRKTEACDDHGQKVTDITHLLGESEASDLNLQGIKCFLKGKVEEAISFYRQAIEKDPSVWKPYHNLSILDTHLDILDRLKNGLKSKELDSTHPGPSLSVAVCYSRLNRKSKALANMKDALSRLKTADYINKFKSDTLDTIWNILESWENRSFIESADVQDLMAITREIMDELEIM